MVRNLTKGKPFPIIMRFCVPILLGSVLQQLYNLLDAFIVRRYVGLAEMGAVLSTGPLNFLVIGFVIGLCAGFSIPVAKSFGGGDIPETRKRAANALYLCGLFALAMTALMVSFARPLLVIMQTPAETLDAAYNYIIVIFAGIPAFMMYNILVALMRALGDSKTPLYFLSASCVLNILVTLLFVAVFGWGTKGAGAATIVSQAFAVTLCLIHIRRHHPILRLKRADARPCRKRAAKLLLNGVPMALQFAITAIGTVIIQRAVNDFGPVVVSAIGVAGRLQIMLMQPMEAVGITMATFCAQNLGAGQYGRIKNGIKISLTAVLIYSIAAGALIIFGGGVLAGLITGEEGAQAMTYIRQFQLVNGAMYWSLGLLFIMRNSVQGLGYSGVTMFAGVSELVARGVVALIMVPRFGFDAVCFANPSAWLLADVMLVVMLVVLLRRVKRKIANKFGNGVNNVQEVEFQQ
ncbi:MAG: MATE family efflux transporter [Oscillospiraceae bacterium]|nr:MATE family efflux transporter [Oscillospiraceae bacterium]